MQRLTQLIFGAVATAHASVISSDAAAVIRSGALHCEETFAPPRLVEDLRFDVAECTSAGLFDSAGSGGRTGEVDHMRSAVYCDPIARDRSVGCWDAIMALWERLDMVREELAAGLQLELLPDMEIHYVQYNDGGYYQRHVDDEATAGTGAPSRRAVSFICYLTEASPAWCAADGGQLRVHTSEGTKDYLPTSGSLVLFDSTTLEHEVLPTCRERTCLIGWFHTPASSSMS